jgi:16S rRNA (uracil1498-N3)-methyltransferase
VFRAPGLRPSTRAVVGLIADAMREHRGLAAWQNRSIEVVPHAPSMTDNGHAGPARIAWTGVPRFHIDATIPRDRPGASFELPEAAANHALRVLRLGTGDAVALFDGTGGEHRGTIVVAGRHAATVRLLEFDPVEREAPVPVTLVMSLISADPMDFALRKAVELGVHAVLPVMAARSQGRLTDERAVRRVAHWRAIAVAACEQCGRNRVPSVEAPVQLATWLADFEGEPGTAAVLAPGAARSLASLAASAPPQFVLVGPEGGFTDDEQALAERLGVVPVHLGSRVLRAETAALTALATVNAIAGDARQDA